MLSSADPLFSSCTYLTIFMPAKKKAQDTDELDNMIIEGELDDADLDPAALATITDADADTDEESEAIVAIPEEGEDPLAIAKAAEDEDEDDIPKEVPVGDGLDDEDGIEALKRAEKELRAEMGLDNMILGGEGAEEPEEE